MVLLRCLPDNERLVAEHKTLDLSERRPWFRSEPFGKDHAYEELNTVLANFVVEAPVTEAWASTLTRLLRIVLIPTGEQFDFTLLDRWVDPRPDPDEGEDYSFIMLRREIAQGLIDRDIRLRLDMSYPFKHADAEVRACFYRSLPPEKLFDGIPIDEAVGAFLWGNGKLTDAQHRVRDLCRDYLEADGERFIDCLNDNMHFWQTKETREFLRDIDSPNLHATSVYLTRREYFLRHSPELFKDEEAVDK
jgi:hypothetical protein